MIQGLRQRRPGGASIAALMIFLASCGGGPGEASPGADASSETGAGEGGEQGAELLATIDGSPLTLADLGSQIGDQLSRMDNQYRSERYRVIESALDGVIQKRLLTEEAAERGVSVEELVASTTEGKVEVTDAEVADWYQRNSARLGGRSLEEVASQVRQYLEQNERAQLVTAFAGKLEGKRDVVYHVAPFRADFNLEGAPSAGPEDAEITLVEFSDFECPFCGRFFPTLHQIKENYGDRVRVVYLQFPLANIHPNAFKAAEASLCAHEQGRFWEMHDLLFEEQAKLAPEELKEKAERLGLDADKFNACLDDGSQVERIRQDVQQGNAQGITGTPAIFINGVQVPGGAVPYETVAAAIDRELRRADSD